jgi:hypothetical protein
MATARAFTCGQQALVALTKNTPTADRHGDMKLGSRGGGSNESYVRAKRHFVLLQERKIEKQGDDKGLWHAIYV